jgi:hypothetical protein
MEEPWAVNPLVPVRLRPVTPKRMRSSMRRELERQSTGLLPRTSQGSSPWRRTTQQPPRGGIGRRTGLRNRSPQGMSVRLGPRGPTSSPVAQRQSSALIRRRPVDRAHPGPPTTSTEPRPSTTKEVCHETDQRRRRELSRSRARGARASRLRRESSAVTALSAARRNSSRSSAATIRAHAAPRSRFKRCGLRSGCF